MSFKEWSSAQVGRNKANSDEKSKVEPTVAKPVENAGNAPIKVTPAPKS
jgi:hypothetical protein